MSCSKETATWFLFALLGLIGAAQIASTYRVLTQTYDEPFHIAAGMEWLQHGTYTIERLHPPLARIAVAFGPYLSGKRLSGENLNWQKAWQEGNILLHADGTYYRNLGLARIGVLPFFFVATGIVWLWSHMLFGSAAALLAVALFTTLPAILGHSALATTDMPAAALFVAALFCFVLWLESPNRVRSLLLGLAVGFALVSKFSNFLFLPACLTAVIVMRFLIRKISFEPMATNVRRYIMALPFSVLIAFLVMWAAYRFSVNPLTSVEKPLETILDKSARSNGLLQELAYKVVEAPVFPLKEIYDGLRQLGDRNKRAGYPFFLGEMRDGGVWYYFPIILAVKTPIPFMILTIAGLCFLVRPLKYQDWRNLAPSVTMTSLLAVSLLSNINIGVRHILAIYPLMAIISGYGGVRLYRIGKSKLCSIVVVALVSWQVISTIYVQPDYLAYFNEFAHNEPERISVDSNLDWGQDLGRLAAVLKARNIEGVAIAYFGTAELDQHGLPEIKRLQPYERITGWIAISLTTLKKNNGFQWLEAHNPIAMVGKSMRLYYISA